VSLAFPGLHVQPEGFAVVGMAALFTGVVRAPLTGIVLVTEMTADVTMLLPMLGACAMAMLMPTLLKDPPIYDSLRERSVNRERARLDRAARATRERRAAEQTLPFAQLFRHPGCSQIQPAAEISSRLLFAAPTLRLKRRCCDPVELNPKAPVANDGSATLTMAATAARRARLRHCPRCRPSGRQRAGGRLRHRYEHAESPGQ
jgi:hypothetical protein